MTVHTNSTAPDARKGQDVAVAPGAGLQLVELHGEPTVRDVDLGARLGMKQPLNIRRVIERNKEEIEGFGPIHAAREMVVIGSGAQREVTEFHLTEEQALAVCQLSRAPRAAEVRRLLIATFTAYRRGHLVPELDRASIGGIVKAVLAKQLREALPAVVAELKAGKVLPTFDYADTVTAAGVLDMAGIRPKDRVRGTAVMVTHALLDYCDAAGCFRTAEDLNRARPWRFPRESAREWLFGSNLGAERIRNQIARQKMRRAKKSGQATFHLVAPRPADDQQPSA